MRKNKLIIVLYVLILIIFFSIIVIYIKNGIKISNLNDMYSDIEILEDEISLYYLNTGKLPIIDVQIDEFYANSINPNDNLVYYEIDLSKLKNLHLSYGNGLNGSKDKYIINEQSHTIYYYDGIKFGKEKIYTIPENYTLIELENYQ